MTPAKPQKNQDPFDLTPRQAAVQAGMGCLGSLLGLVLLCLGLLVAIGWGLSHSTPLRWVVERGVNPALDWAGYPDFQVTVHDASRDWVTLGPTRLGESVAFEQGRVSINPFSDYFGQVVLWGADVAMVRADQGWALAPLAKDRMRDPDLPEIAPEMLPALQRPDLWWMHPWTLPLGLTLVDSRIHAQAQPVSEGAEGPMIEISAALWQTKGTIGELMAGDALHGHIEAQARTSTADALGLPRAEVLRDSPLTVSLSGVWHWQDQQLTLPNPKVSAAVGKGFRLPTGQLEDELLLSAEAQPAPTGEATDAASDIAANSPAEPMLVVILPENWEADSVTTVLPRMRVNIEPMRLSLEGQEPLQTTSLVLNVKGILTVGEETPTLIRSLSVALEGGKTNLFGTELRAVKALIDVETDRPTLEVTAQLPRLPGMPGAFSQSSVYPLSLDLSLQPSVGEGPNLLRPWDFSLTAKKADQGGLLRVSGQADFVASQVQATVRLVPQTFIPQGLQPHHLLPSLAAMVSETQGRLSASGTIRWDGRRIRPDLSIALENMVLRQGFLLLENINGVVRLTGFDPLRTPDGQELSIGAIKAGLPLSNGAFRFHFDGAGGLMVEQATMEIAKGQVRIAQSPIALDPLSGRINLEVQGVDLATLSKFGELDGLSADGTLQGTVPMVLTGSDIIIENGHLETNEPGVIQYRPSDVPAILQTGGSLDLLMRALDDFHYDGLSMTLNGAASGDLQAGLHINGANPMLYDGFPIELNLSISGALSQLVSDSMGTSAVPERVRKRVEQIMGQ